MNFRKIRRLNSNIANLKLEAEHVIRYLVIINIVCYSNMDVDDFSCVQYSFMLCYVRPFKKYSKCLKLLNSFHCSL